MVKVGLVTALRPRGRVTRRGRTSSAERALPSRDHVPGRRSAPAGRERPSLGERLSLHGPDLEKSELDAGVGGEQRLGSPRAADVRA